MKLFNCLIIVSITFFLLSQSFGQGTYIKGPALIEGFTEITSAAGTTALTKDSQTKQIVTGTTTQTITLPNATNLPLGRKFLVISSTTGNVTVNDNSGALLTVILPGSSAEFHLRANGSAAGTWDVVNNGIGTSAITTEWQSHTPATAQQGFGNISGVDYKWRQVGSSINLEVSFVAGTVTATQARFELPNSWTIAASSSSKAVGSMFSTATLAGSISVIAVGGNSYLLFGAQTSGAGGATSANGSDVAGTGATQKFFATVKIAELSSFGTTFKTDCGFTGDCLNIFSAKISSGGVVTDENVNWINGNCSSSSAYTCTYNASFFSTAPSCVVSAADSSNNFGSRIESQSSSAITVRTLNPSTLSTANGAFNIVCTRQGSDLRPSINAPLINNSVTSSSNGFELINRARLTPTGSGCTINSQSGSWITSAAGVSNGDCQLNITGYSSSPTCTTFVNSNAANRFVTGVGTWTSSFIRFNVQQSGGTGDNSTFDLICIGPR